MRDKYFNMGLDDGYRDGYKKRLALVPNRYVEDYVIGWFRGLRLALKNA